MEAQDFPVLLAIFKKCLQKLCVCVHVRERERLSVTPPYQAIILLCHTSTTALT